MKYLSIKPDPFVVRFHVFVGKWDLVQIKGIFKNTKKTNITEPDIGMTGAFWDCGDHKIIWLRKKDFEIGLLVHECIHAVVSAGAFLGFRFDSEYQAYMAQHLVDSILDWRSKWPAGK